MTSEQSNSRRPRGLAKRLRTACRVLLVACCISSVGAFLQSKAFPGHASYFHARPFRTLRAVAHSSEAGRLSLHLTVASATNELPENAEAIRNSETWPPPGVQFARERNRGWRSLDSFDLSPSFRMARSSESNGRYVLRTIDVTLPYVSTAIASAAGWFWLRHKGPRGPGFDVTGAPDGEERAKGT
jgi:hypothetical protein